MSRSLPLLLLVVTTCVPGTIAAGPTFRYRKAVDRGDTRGEVILAAVLDPDVYAATRDGFPDVRIIDGAGVEVPYVLEAWSRRIAERVRESCESELVSLRENADHSLEIVLALKEKSPFAEGMTVVSPLRDFENRVRVEGSTAGAEWTPLVDSGIIFDYSRYMDVRNRDVVLPPNRARRFRLRIDLGLDELVSPLMGLVKDSRGGDRARSVEIREVLRRPFRIDRIDLWRTVERQSELRPEKVPYQATVLRVEQDSKEKVTRVDLRSRREPITGFIPRTTSRNFSRQVRVLVPVKDAIGESWREIGRGQVHRFQLQDFHDETLLVEFPEQRSETYRIVIEDGDSPPLEISSIDAQGTSYRLSFVASEGGDYRVVYGSDDAGPPRYDAAAVLAALGPTHQAVAIGLGPEVVDRTAPPPSLGLKKWLNSKVVLMLAMAIMIVVLAWALFRAGKQITKLPDPEA